eukprot:TRINITY_DN12297_c0_g1_i1.p1 TRINITY_DN12297_c0_g1~~TRINITY_DN12297_c0_g1_i1.p1  ORF type:complete len:277 (+),score=70.47 TRINITY_DN12297_c0_g1_i1:143-973(+)
MKFGKAREKKEALETDDNFNDVENNNYCRKDSRANLIVTGLEACRPDTFLNPSLTSLTLVDPVFDFQFRIILVGESTVGKTSLLRALTKTSFWAGEEATVGVDFVARNIKVGGSKIKLHLWDTAGQERFRFLSRSYYRNSVGVVVAYSILRRSTFEGVERWVEEAREHAGSVPPTIIIVGCKLDLVDIGCKREVSYEEGRELAKSLDALFIETSAKQGVAVEEAFKCLCDGILAKIETGEIEIMEEMEGIKLGRKIRSGSLYSRKDLNVKRNSCCF